MLPCFMQGSACDGTHRCPDWGGEEKDDKTVEEEQHLMHCKASNELVSGQHVEHLAGCAWGLHNADSPNVMLLPYQGLKIMECTVWLKNSAWNLQEHNPSWGGTCVEG